MELAFFVIGFLFIITALRDNVAQFFGAIEQDLIGPGGFLIWAGLLVAIWLGGKVLGLDKAASLLIWLLVGVFVLKNPEAVTAAPSQLSTATGTAPSEVSTGEATRAGNAAPAANTPAPTTPASAAPGSLNPIPIAQQVFKLSPVNIPNIFQ